MKRAHSETVSGTESPDEPAEIHKHSKRELTGKQIAVGLAKKYKCDFEGCDKAYKKPSLLEQHKRSHLDVRPFSCHLCEMSFLRKSHLSAHIISHQEEKPFHCKVCGKGVNTKQHLKRHEITHEKSFRCDKCDESFYKNIQLKNHVKSVHEDKLTCKVCGKKYQRPYRLANHRERAHKLAPQYQCTHEDCLLLFKTWSELQNHIKSEHPKLKCEICGKQCVGDSGLQMHMIIHSDNNVKKWECSKCDRVFGRKRNLEEHARSHETQETKVETDSESDFESDSETESVDSKSESSSTPLHSTKTQSVESLLQRKSVFDILASQATKSEKPIKCEIGSCTRTFKTEYALKRHMDWHLTSST